MQEMEVQSLGQEDTLEEKMETHFSILAWKIPRTEDPGRLQSKGSQTEHISTTQKKPEILGKMAVSRPTTEKVQVESETSSYTENKEIFHEQWGYAISGWIAKSVRLSKRIVAQKTYCISPSAELRLLSRENFTITESSLMPVSGHTIPPQHSPHQTTTALIFSHCRYPF